MGGGYHCRAVFVLVGYSQVNDHNFLVITYTRAQTGV